VAAQRERRSGPARKRADGESSGSSSIAGPERRRLPALLGTAGLLLVLAAWLWHEPIQLWFLARGPLTGLEQYSAQHPESAAAASDLGRAYLRTGRPADAVRVLGPAVERSPADPTLRTELGEALFSAGNLQLAYANLQVALNDLHASGPETLWWLGQVEERVGQTARAGERYTEALKREPNHLGALLRLAKYAAGAGRYTEAEIYYRRAAKAHPRSAEAATGVAETDYRAGRMDAAVREARRAVSLAPESAEAQLWLGRSLQAQDGAKNAAEAEAAYRHAIASSPEPWVPRRYLAQLFRERGRIEDAAKELTTNVKENRLDEQSYYDLAQCQRALGRTADAAVALARFHKLNKIALQDSQLEYRSNLEPENKALRLQLARFYVKNGRPDLARPHVDRLLHSSPVDPEARGLAAEIAAHPNPTL
jgi:tetratricopeptide (TPR) repeat protein